MRPGGRLSFLRTSLLGPLGVLLAVLFLAAATLFMVQDYRKARASAEEAWRLRLLQLCRARVELIFRWAATRSNDATDLAASYFSRTLGTATGHPADKRLFERRLGLLARGYGYKTICVADAGSNRVFCSGGDEDLGGRLQPSRLAALRPGACEIFPIQGGGDDPLLCFAARDRDSSAAGAFLIVDPARFLYPALQTDVTFGVPVGFLLASLNPDALIAYSQTTEAKPPSSSAAPAAWRQHLAAFPRADDLLEPWGDEFYAVRRPIPGTRWLCAALVPRAGALKDMRRQFAARAAAVSAFALALIAVLFGVGRELELRHVRALSREEERLRLLSENAAEMVLYLEADGAIVDCNRAAESAAGLGKAELCGRRLGDLFLPSGADESKPFLESAFGSGAMVEGLWRHPGRGLVPVEASCRGVDIEGRRLAIFVARDISARKEAERELMEQRRSLETLLANLPGMAYRCRNDRGWTMEFVSAGVRALTGYDPEELSGGNAVPYADLIHPEDREKVWQDVQGALERKESFTLTYRIRTKSGEERTVWERGCGIFEPGPGLTALEGFITDVSDRARAEEALQAAQDALDQARKLEVVGLVASGVAHEVRNPLFAISTIVTALDQKLKDRPEYGEYVGHIQDQVRRLSSLMNDLLALGRPVETEGFREWDLASIVRDSVHHLDQVVEGAELRCRLDLAETGVTIKGSQERLEQVVLNLAQNALAFSPPDQPVHLRVYADGEDAVLEVWDSGPGIPAPLLDHLFEPFQSKRKGGTGLGLAIVRKIVSAHGGTVEAENMESPSGARFTVRIPLWNPRSG